MFNFIFGDLDFIYMENMIYLRQLKCQLTLITTVLGDSILNIKKEKTCGWSMEDIKVALNSCCKNNNK